MSDDVELGHVGSADGLSVAYEMNDNEILEYQEEQKARAARRVPAGFGAQPSSWGRPSAGRPAGTWPTVPRFDIGG